MKDRKAAIIVPAAGSGSRMRQPGLPSKQFRVLGDAPLIVQTLRVLQRHTAIDEIVVAAPEDDVDSLRSLVAEHGLEKVTGVVLGGATRQESVRNALASVSPDVEIVGVHDGVRPFLSSGMLSSVLLAAVRHGAAALAIPAVDTLRRSDGSGAFAATVSREGLWRMQTPQIAMRDHLVRAYSTSDVVGTDEVELLQWAGVRVALVPGSPLNIKVTTTEDLEHAEAIWPWWVDRENLEAA